MQLKLLSGARNPWAALPSEWSSVLSGEGISVEPVSIRRVRRVRGSFLLIYDGQQSLSEAEGDPGAKLCERNRALVICREVDGQSLPVQLALRMGALCIGTVGDATEEQFYALRALRCGRRYVSSRALQAVMDNAAGQEALRPGTTTALTRRQREVLELVAAGSATSEIADTLFIEKSTVDDHIKCILRVMGTRTRAAAVYQAARSGML